MSEDPESRTRSNLGWYYMDALKSIAKRGRWPTGLTVGERRRIKEAGLVKLVYVPMKGWKPVVLSGDNSVKDNHR